MSNFRHTESTFTSTATIIAWSTLVVATGRVCRLFLTFTSMAMILIALRSSLSSLQFITTGAGSKAWRGAYNPTMEILQLFYDGQGFISLQLTKAEAKLAFYDIFGNVLHQWNSTK